LDARDQDKNIVYVEIMPRGKGREGGPRLRLSASTYGSPSKLRASILTMVQEIPLLLSRPMYQMKTCRIQLSKTKTIKMMTMSSKTVPTMMTANKKT
jgi:hypothetical protein